MSKDFTITSPTSKLPPTGEAIELGLTWLGAGPAPDTVAPTDNWPDYLAGARNVKSGPRLRWFALLFWVGAINGVLALSGLMVWPDNSGIHLLIFLMVFWLAPLTLLIWTLINAWWRKRSPWWRHWMTAYDDAVIASWCAEQSLKAQALFALAGLGWLWLMLLTRQLIFYWSTSLPAASARVDDLFRVLTLAVLDTPEPLAISASQAGSITGWETALLSYSGYWAFWLTQVVLLWVVVPVSIGLLVNRRVLRHRLAHWPSWNRALHLQFEQQKPDSLHFEALTPEQPRTFEASDRDLDSIALDPSVPVLAWLEPSQRQLPAGSLIVGRDSLSNDEVAIERHAAQEKPIWVIAADATPTGDLADLITLSAGTHKEVDLLLYHAAEPGSQARKNQRQSWQGFISNQELPARLYWLAEGSGHAH